jgi:hypothetical protein
MWTSLCALCEVRDPAHKHNTLKKFYELKFVRDRDISAYIAQVNLHASECRNVGVVLSDTDIITKLTHGLPPSFDPLVYAFEARAEEHKTVDVLTALLVRQETRLKEVVEANMPESKAEPESAALVHHTGGSGMQNQRRKFGGSCSTCGKRGHMAKHCWNNMNSNGARTSQHNFNGSGGRPNNFNANGPYNRNGNNNPRNHNGNGRFGQGNRNRNANFAETEEYYDDESASVPAYCATSSAVSSDFWIGDSGAGDHITRHCDWFESSDSTAGEITVILGDDHRLQVKGIGSVRVRSDQGKQFTLDRVLHVPGLKRNLFSLGEVTSKDLEVRLKGHSLQIVEKESVVLTGTLISKGTYRMNIETVSAVQANTSESETDVLQTWHQRLGHVNIETLRKTIQHSSLLGINCPNFTDYKLTCIPCIKRKMTRSTFPTTNQRAKSAGELIHFDFAGPIVVNGWSGRTDHLDSNKPPRQTRWHGLPWATRQAFVLVS